MAPVLILAIEDSLTIRKLVEISLSELPGWRVEFAVTGLEGIKKAIGNPPDLILLDYMLPDMKAPEICDQLSADQRTASVPIILVTGKDVRVRDQILRSGRVVDFLSKPFSSEALVARINAQLEQRAVPRTSTEVPRAETVPRPLAALRWIKTVPFAHKQAAARSLFGRLKESFAKIPGWIEEMGEGVAPAPYLARKVLNPDLIDDLLESLLPFYRGQLETTPRPIHSVEPLGLLSSPMASADGEAAVSGSFKSWTLLELLDCFLKPGQQGKLRIVQRTHTNLIYCRGEEILLATCDNPDVYRIASGIDLSTLAPELLQPAVEEQRASLRPIFVSLADAGHWPVSELPRALSDTTKRLIQTAIDAGPGSFNWQPEINFPDYVTAHTRVLSRGQIGLEHLRHLGRESSPAPQLAPAAILERAEAFSERLRHFDLNEEERRALYQVDGRSSIERLAERSGTDLKEILSILSRLKAVGLLVPTSTKPSRTVNRIVMVLDPDIDGIQSPLAAWLETRSEPFEVASLDGRTDIRAAIRRERPSLVLINIEAAGSAAERLALAVREDPELADLAMVALLEAPSTTQTEALLTARYTAVLNKPILYTEFEALLP